jgi:sodium transport system permease protein
VNKIKIIFVKELLDSLRDYRSWSTGLFWAVFGPLMMGGMLVLIGSSVREDIEKPLNLPVQNAENAPSLIQFLEQNDVVIEPAPENPETAVRNGDYLGRLRLIVRGVSPEVIQAVDIEEVDVATPQSRATFFISFLPYFIIFAIFNGAAPIITDTTAGERERQSLEPLLINPVPRRTVVLGKLLAAFPFSLASLAITLIGFGAVFNVLPVEEYLGIRIGLNVLTLILIFLICLPIVFLASAIQMVVASFTRSTKEAGTYLPFIALIPSLPGLALAFFPVKPVLWTMLIPTFGQQILINQFMRLEPVSVSNAVISTVMTLVISAGITLIAIRLYNREQIVIRKG